MVERPDGREIAKPVELRVMVGDANDNRPTFPTTQYHTVVKELAPRGEAQPSEHSYNTLLQTTPEHTGSQRPFVYA